MGKDLPLYKEMMRKATQLLDKPLKALDLKIGAKSPQSSLIQDVFNTLFSQLSANSSLTKILKTQSASLLSGNNFKNQIETLALK